MSTVPLAWQGADAWCSGCNCLVELCECPRCMTCDERCRTVYDGRCGRCAAKRLDLEGQLELSVIDSQLSKLLKEKRSA